MSRLQWVESRETRVQSRAKCLELPPSRLNSQLSGKYSQLETGKAFPAQTLSPPMVDPQWPTAPAGTIGNFAGFVDACRRLLLLWFPMTGEPVDGGDDVAFVAAVENGDS